MSVTSARKSFSPQPWYIFSRLYSTTNRATTPLSASAFFARSSISWCGIRRLRHARMSWKYHIILRVRVPQYLRLKTQMPFRIASKSLILSIAGHILATSYSGSQAYLSRVRSSRQASWTRLNGAASFMISSGLSRMKSLWSSSSMWTHTASFTLWRNSS